MVKAIEGRGLAAHHVAREAAWYTSEKINCALADWQTTAKEDLEQFLRRQRRTLMRDEHSRIVADLSWARHYRFPDFSTSLSSAPPIPAGHLAHYRAGSDKSRTNDKPRNDKPRRTGGATPGSRSRPPTKRGKTIAIARGKDLPTMARDNGTRFKTLCKDNDVQKINYGGEEVCGRDLFHPKGEEGVRGPGNCSWVHWADRDKAAVLASLARRPAASR